MVHAVLVLLAPVPVQAQAPVRAQQACSGEDDGSGEQVIDLGNPAMLAQLQQLVQQNPAALQPLVQAIAQSNPQLAEAMNHDPQGVLSLLAGGAGGAGEEMELPTLAELSDEDRAGVEQIVAMASPRQGDRVVLHVRQKRRDGRAVLL